MRHISFIRKWFDGHLIDPVFKKKMVWVAQISHSNNQSQLKTNALPVVIEYQDERGPSPFEVKAVTAIW